MRRRAVHLREEVNSSMAMEHSWLLPWPVLLGFFLAFPMHGPRAMSGAGGGGCIAVVGIPLVPLYFPGNATF